jgi:hypothetical protein
MKYRLSRWNQGIQMCRRGRPGILKMEDVATRTYAFLVDVDDEVFRSTTRRQ